MSSEFIVEEESDTAVRIRLTRLTYRYHLADELGNLMRTDEVVSVADELYGGDENDLILTGEGGDRVWAKSGAGRDVLFGQGGDDYLDGGR